MAKAAAISLFAICLSALSLFTAGPGNRPYHPSRPFLARATLTATQSWKLSLAYEVADATTTTTAPAPPPVPETTVARIPPSTVPAPPQTPSAVPTEASGSWQALVLSLPWDGQLMLQVAWCESRDEPTAVNGSSFGLFQVQGETSTDTTTQVEDAYHWKYLTQGMEAWVSSERCWG